MRSQTTRKLIQKIKNESGKSRLSNYDACASVPSLNSFHNSNLFEEKEAAGDSKEQTDKQDSSEPRQGQNQKKKCFEYSIHKVASTQNNSEQRPEPQPRTFENVNAKPIEETK